MRNIVYNLGIIVQHFGLKVLETSPLIEQWGQAKGTLNTAEQALFYDLLADAKIDSGYWNEEELKIYLVGTVFRLAKVNEIGKIKVFYERPLTATVQDESLSVVADCLVATPLPYNTPAKPYFFLQEFKKRKGDKYDPEAQMLVAMLIAQETNKDGKPIFGGYLIGQNWYFTILENNTYCQTRQYDSQQEADLLKIVFMLRQLKTFILGDEGQNKP